MVARSVKTVAADRCTIGVHVATVRPSTAVMMLLIWIILNWLKQETDVKNIFFKLSRVKTGLKELRRETAEVFSLPL